MKHFAASVPIEVSVAVRLPAKLWDPMFEFRMQILETENIRFFYRNESLLAWLQNEAKESNALSRNIVQLRRYLYNSSFPPKSN